MTCQLMIGREFSLSTLSIVAYFVLQVVAFIMKMTTLMVSRYMEFSSMSCSEMNLGPTLSTRVNLLVCMAPLTALVPSFL